MNTKTIALKNGIVTTQENASFLSIDDGRIVRAIAAEARTMPTADEITMLDRAERVAHGWARVACPSSDMRVYRGGKHVAVSIGTTRVLLIAVVA